MPTQITDTSISVSIPAQTTLTRRERDLCLNPHGMVEDFEELEYDVCPVTPRDGVSYWYRAPGVIGFLNSLIYALGYVNFAGIRYAGDPTWRGVLDTVAFGVPEAVRFRKAAAPNTDAQ